MAISEEERERRHREDLECLKRMRLMDDDFLTKCFEGDTENTQLILRILINIPDLVVTDVHTQVFVANLLKRSVKLDILAVDSGMRRYNIEIQRADAGAGKKRAQFYSGMMDANFLDKGTDWNDLPETYVVFITENDVVGRGEPLYEVERCYLKTVEPFGDGSHIIYVNGAYRGETPVGRLMHDFFCTDPEDMYYKSLSDRVRFFKKEKEGVAIMCKMIEDMRNEAFNEGEEEGRKKGIKEGRENQIRETAINMLAKGKYHIEEIADILGMPLDEVKKLSC